MDKIYFVTDLDRTIIHSKHKGYKCVEKLEEREITYMTEKAYMDLQELLKVQEFIFIPCTMRNLKQTLRVDFIREYNPHIMICCNGGQLYINGELDLKWKENIDRIIDIKKIASDIIFLDGLKEKHKDTIQVLEVRNIENLYIEVKSLNEGEATKFFNIIKDKFTKDLKVLQIKAKIFIINKKINKVEALEYLINKYNIKNLITAGDSIVDREFTTKGISILPRHASFKHEQSIITEKIHIHSTEDILDNIKKVAKNMIVC